MKDKKPLYKKWWFWAILVIIGLYCIGSNTDTNTISNNINTTSSSVETSNNIQENTIKNTQNEENNLAIEEKIEIIEEENTQETEIKTETEIETKVETELVNNKIEENTKVEEIKNDYILNINSKIFHYHGCSGVTKMKDKNKKEITATRDEMIKKGYKPCGICKP